MAVPPAVDLFHLPSRVGQAGCVPNTRQRDADRAGRVRHAQPVTGEHERHVPGCEPGYMQMGGRLIHRAAERLIDHKQTTNWRSLMVTGGHQRSLGSGG
jgi:hypothetical protein